MRLAQQILAGITLATSIVAAGSTVAWTAGGALDGHVVLERLPISERHTGITREIAAGKPRREDDQVVVDGWPMYRTERGQESFNHAMATLKATDQPPPGLAAFQGCADLKCRLALPMLTSRGWIPAGRLWVSPAEYVLIVHSPRRSKYDPGKRRSRRGMRYFVFHEFHNSTGNTDLFDTISAHRRSVFVPFYLGKPGRDAQGRRYVVVVQVSPHDIVSRHARVFGSAGPGIEVAKNTNQRLSRLQAQAGILVATIVKRAVPHLRMVRHRGSEGRPMLRAYESRRRAVKRMRGTKRIRLPFVAADAGRVARATGSLKRMIAHAGPVRIRPLVSPDELRPSVFASLPRLVAAPRLVAEFIGRPVLTMDKLLQRILRTPIAPKPQLACRTEPGFICR
ncbi:MAG: hypothetical protein ACI89J_001446 [Hyphomicrobiaceae bacterium]|jgi:hypothetical protein